MMKLFEVSGNAWGDSFVRCYVWAESAERARQLATDRMAEREIEVDEVLELFAADAAEFCTPLSDSGFECE